MRRPPPVGFGAVDVGGAAKLHVYQAATGAARFVTDFGAYGGTADDGATPAVLTDSHYSAGGVVFFTNGAARNPQYFQSRERLYARDATLAPPGSNE